MLCKTTSGCPERIWVVVRWRSSTIRKNFDQEVLPPVEARINVTVQANEKKMMNDVYFRAPSTI